MHLHFALALRGSWPTETWTSPSKPPAKQTSPSIARLLQNRRRPPQKSRSSRPRRRKKRLRFKLPHNSQHVEFWATRASTCRPGRPSWNQGIPAKTTLRNLRNPSSAPLRIAPLLGDPGYQQFHLHCKNRKSVSPPSSSLPLQSLQKTPRPRHPTLQPHPTSSRLHPPNPPWDQTSEHQLLPPPALPTQ